MLRDDLVVDTNGEVDEEATARIAELRAELAEALEDLAGVERELRGKRSTITRLRAEQGAAVRSSPRYEPAMHVLQEWKRLCAPRAKELDGRAELVIARLEGAYSEDDLKTAIAGYAAFPFVVEGRRSTRGQPAQRFVDAELIFRDARHVDAGLTLAHQAEGFASVLQPPDPTGNGILSPFGLKARDWAQFGIPVLATKPNGKEPATIHGLKDASADVILVTAFWQAHPNCNVAVRTGAESGLVVLDVDGEYGFESLNELQAEYEQLPRTRSVVTPRGGEHFFFRHPGVPIRNTQGSPALGLDVRGDNGYVLVPPSVVNGRPYEVDEEADVADMPKWLVDLLVELQGKVSAEVIGPTIAKGRQHSTLISLGGSMRNRGMGQAEIAAALKVTNKQRLEQPAPDSHIEKIAASICRYPPGEVT